MKKGLRYFLVITILMVLTLSSTQATVIHEETQSDSITPFISYVEKTQFKSNKWIVIKSLIVDITDEQTSIKALYNKDNLRESKKLSELVPMNENILGAINGDFFNSTQKTAIGPLIDEKKMIYNGIDDTTFNVFGITKVNKPFIGHVKNFKPDAKIGKISVPVSYINKNFTNLNAIVLLNNAYGKTSIGNTTDVELTEVVISNNQVEEIRHNQAAVEIPEDGYVISIPKHSNFDTQAISTGDSFVLEDPKILQMLDTLIGGGSILVENGELSSEFSLPIKGNHPRSAIGFTEDYSKVILTTVEGRQSYVPGVTETELANIMIDLGAYYAINLDGGGSSTLIKRDYGKDSYQPTNYLSDGTERRVYNGIGIASSYDTNTIHSLKLNLDHEHTILRQPITIDILGSDEYYNPIAVDESLLEFSSTLEGEFIDNIFYPTETGKGFITVEYKDLSHKQPIEIHEDLAEITFNKNHLKLSKDEQVNLNPKIITAKGYEIPIDLEQLEFDLPQSSYSINQDTFILKEDLQDQIITVTYNDLKSQLSLNVNTFDTVLLDDFETLKGTHAVYPLDLTGKFNLFNTSIDGSTSGRLFYNFSKHPTETRASYYVYDEGLSIPEDASKVKLDVFGTLGKNHWLRLKVRDQNNKEHNLTLARNIDWRGWKTVETDIPDYIEGPISVERIYVVETDFSNANDGLLLIDNLRTEMPIQIDLEKVTQYKDIFEKTMDTNYQLDNLYVANEVIDIKSDDFKIMTNHDELLNKYPDLSLDTGSDYSSLKDSNKLLLKLNNKNRTLNHDDGNQWLFLKEKIQEDDSQNLLIYLSNPFALNNRLERDLFIKLLDEHHEKNDSNIFIITESDTFNLSYIEGFPIIQLNMNETFELRFNFFKSFAKFNLELK